MTDESVEADTAAEDAAYTSADEWPADDGGEDLVLPSGAKVRVAPPPVLWLGMTGQIPAHLVAIARHHEADGKDWTPAENMQAIEWLVAVAFVEPKVSIARKAGYLPISKLSDRDKEAVAMKLRIQNYAAALK